MPIGSVGVPARLPSAFPSSRARPSTAGGRGAKRAAACPQARCRLLMSAPCPHGTETCSGVGRVARRARLAAQPFSRVLPRLTLKAGHKAGLPTTPHLAAARKAPAVAPISSLLEQHTGNGVYRDILEHITTPSENAKTA